MVTEFELMNIYNDFKGILSRNEKWQRARDSNPRRREPRRFSKPVQSTNSVNSLHIDMVRMIGIEPILPNGNWILSPTRLPIPPHSQYTLGKQLRYYLLKLDGNYNRFFLPCQEFFERILKFVKIYLFNKNWTAKNV